MLGDQLLTYRIEIRCRLRDRRAGFDPAYRLQMLAGPARVAQSRVIAERRPDLRRLVITRRDERFEVRGHDADDLELHVVDAEPPADDAGIASETRTPKAIAEQHDAPSGLGVVGRPEVPSERRVDARVSRRSSSSRASRGRARPRPLKRASPPRIESPQSTRTSGCDRAGPAASRIRCCSLLRRESDHPARRAARVTRKEADGGAPHAPR